MPPLARGAPSTRWDGDFLLVSAGTRGRRRDRVRTVSARTSGLTVAVVLTLAVGIAAAGAVPGAVPGGVADLVVAARTGEGQGGADGPSTQDANAHGKAVSELAKSLEGGCEKGQAISALASSKSRAHRQDDPDKHDPCSGGGGQAKGKNLKDQKRNDAGAREPGRPDHAGPPEGVPGGGPPAR